MVNKSANFNMNKMNNVYLSHELTERKKKKSQQMQKDIHILATTWDMHKYGEMAKLVNRTTAVELPSPLFDNWISNIYTDINKQEKTCRYRWKE
jgi:NAD+--asparagine ADP-ribosyltransferase